jgi:hypothetical protein
MAHEEPVTGTPVTHDVSEHVEGYESFTRLLKWGAVACFVIGMVWMMIVKAYW